MGESRKLIWGVLTLLAAWLGLAAAAHGSPQPVANPWLDQAGILNMAHQGGELEAPSSTIYAFRTALEERGADSLEMDVNATADGRLAVMHDYYTRRITPVDAQVRDLDLAHLQALDAAWWFSPGSGHFDHSRPAGQYPLRGVRTGDRPPPAGYTANDFRVPVLEEVLEAFPGVPLNIEIKTVPGEPGEALRVATLLAGILARPEHRGRPVIVVSLDQEALERFHQLAPDVHLAASLSSMLNFVNAGLPVKPDAVAMQVPMSLLGFDPPQMLKDLDANGHGYAVHAWTDGERTENDETYARLTDSNVQGIITSTPSRLHDYLCRTGQRRPDNSPRCQEQAMKFRLAFPSRSLRQYLRHGLPVRARCDQACRLALEIRIVPRMARRLGIRVNPRRVDGRGLVLIGTQRPSRGAAPDGVALYRANAHRHAHRRLARVRRVTVEVTVHVFDSTGHRAEVQRRWLTLRSKRPLRAPAGRR